MPGTMFSQPNPQPGDGGQRRTRLIVGGAVAAVALAAGAFVLFGGDDEGNGSVMPGTTVLVAPTVDGTEPDETDPTVTDLPTTVPTTVATTVPATVPATLPATLPSDVAAALLGALPSAADVPDTWEIASNPDPAPPALSGPGVGYCNGPNGVSRAIAAGAGVQVHGTEFFVGNGGAFAVSAFWFEDTNAAASFVEATKRQVSECTSASPYTMPESEFDMFENGYGDDAVWNFMTAETKVQSTSPAGGVPTLLVHTKERGTTTVEGFEYGVIVDDITTFEQNGRVVLIFNLNGWHDMTGFANGEPDWAYTPTVPDLAGLVIEVRRTILDRLGGLL